MDSFQAELVISIQEVISLSAAATTNSDNHELCAIRLEILAESTLTHEDIPLEAVDLINKAIHLLCGSQDARIFDHEPYVSPSDSNIRARGRPKYYISEEQLMFFKGRK